MKQNCLAACRRIAVAFALAQTLPAAAAQLEAGSAGGVPYPNRPIRMLVGLPAGGSVDVVARIVSAKLGDALGQPIVIDNRSGASGLIAAETVAQAPPDGHTLLFGASFYSEVLALAHNRLPYDPVRDFAPISLVTKVPNVLVVHPALSARTVSEFIAHAKAHPGRLNYASSGNGSSAHLSMEMLKKQTGIDVVHVPYKSAPQALVDLLAGAINAMFGNVPAQLPHLQRAEKPARWRSLPRNASSSCRIFQP
jgi:tripartite-type tricarboxylate transporter receptor subunit TctC